MSYLQVVAEQDDESFSPTTLLKASMPKAAGGDTDFVENLDENQCFNMLREMELVDDDEVEEADLNEEETLGEETEKPDEAFPTLTEVMGKSKWGPTQATRTSSRMVDSQLPVLLKAQQLKRMHNLEIPRDKGIKSMPFSLFNNPSFVAIAGKVGVEISNTHDPSCCNDHDISRALGVGVVGNKPGCGSTVGADSSPRTPTVVSNNNFVADREVGDLDSDGESESWTRVCRNRRGKHPRKGIPI